MLLKSVCRTRVRSNIPGCRLTGTALPYSDNLLGIALPYSEKRWPTRYSMVFPALLGIKTLLRSLHSLSSDCAFHPALIGVHFLGGLDCNGHVSSQEGPIRAWKSLDPMHSLKIILRIEEWLLSRDGLQTQNSSNPVDTVEPAVFREKRWSLQKPEKNKTIWDDFRGEQMMLSGRIYFQGHYHLHLLSLYYRKLSL